MRVRQLVVRFRTPIRILVMLGSLALIVLLLGMMLRWWPTPKWVEASGIVWLATCYQTVAIRWIRQGPVFAPILEHWSVRLVEIGAVLTFSFMELPSVFMMFPGLVGNAGELLLMIPLVGFVLVEVGALAAGFHYNAAETDRAVRRYRAMHIQGTDTAE